MNFKNPYQFKIHSKSNNPAPTIYLPTFQTDQQNDIISYSYNFLQHYIKNLKLLHHNQPAVIKLYYHLDKDFYISYLKSNNPLPSQHVKRFLAHFTPEYKISHRPFHVHTSVEIAPDRVLIDIHAALHVSNIRIYIYIYRFEIITSGDIGRVTKY